MAHLDALKAAVTKIETEADSLIAFTQGLAAKLEEFKNDPVEIQAIVDQLNAQSQELSDAVLANTPSEPST